MGRNLLAGYPRVAIGGIWFESAFFGWFLWQGAHIEGRWIFALMVGFVAGPVMIIWGLIEMVLRPKPKAGGVYENDYAAEGPMPPFVDALCFIAKADGPPSAAVISEITRVLNSDFQSDVSVEAVADRVRRFKAQKIEEFAQEWRISAATTDSRLRADFAKGLFDVANANGPPSPPRARACVLMIVAVNPPPETLTEPMRALMAQPAR